MRVISKKALVEFWKKVPASEQQLNAWYCEAKDAEWRDPTDVKAKYGNASILKGSRVVFNICGNKYRLVVLIKYDFKTVYVRFVGTHKEYDNVDAESV